MSKATSPRLETERLILRPYAKSDGPRISSLLKSREVTRYTFMPHPYRPSDYYAFVRKINTVQARRRNLVFALLEKSTDDLIGGVGCHNIDADAKKCEIGYWLAKKYWGEGLMPEAVAAIVTYLFRVRKLRRVYAKVWHPNAKSARVLEKVGFTLEGKLRQDIKRNGRWMDVLVFGMLREEWSGKKKTRRKISAGLKSRKNR